jgi:[ribosomal protein S5]-alanine N-acetyltransferase
MIETSRLQLIPATLAHVSAEIANRSAFAQLIPAEIPANWPPESTVDALPLFRGWLERAPDRVGWFGWYALARNVGAQDRTLIASGGFLGPPQDGVVNIGYSVLPQFQRRGFATEMTARLVQWAFEEPAVNRIAAETEWANSASVRVLIKLGFIQIHHRAGTDAQKFELSRNEWSRAD